MNTRFNFTDSKIRSIQTQSKRKEYYDKHTKGLCLRITPKGTKSFSYEYKNSVGSKKRMTIGRYPDISLKQARDKILQLKAQLSEGIDPKHNQEKEKEYSVRELCNKYLDEGTTHLVVKTRSEYERYIHDYILPKFGGENSARITKREVAEFLDKIAFQDEHLTTSNRVKSTLSSVYSFANRKFLIDHHPVQGIEKKPEKSKERVYSDKELQQLWFEFEKYPQPTGLLFKILLLCGRRLSEAMQAKWEHVTFGDNPIWLIPAENAKNKKELTIPLNGLVLEEFIKLKELSTKDRYVFESPVDPNLHISSISTAKKYVRERSGIEDFTPHDLRRTAITKLAELGTPREVIEKISNHNQGTSNNVHLVYNRHHYLKEMDEALQKYSDHIRSMVNNC
ncbi:MAG: integrase arm-type DNA-binding domain-containing protein [Balneolaceae bacterium]